MGAGNEQGLGGGGGLVGRQREVSGVCTVTHVLRDEVGNEHMRSKIEEAYDFGRRHATHVRSNRCPCFQGQVASCRVKVPSNYLILPLLLISLAAVSLMLPAVLRRVVGIRRRKSSKKVQNLDVSRPPYSP